MSRTEPLRTGNVQWLGGEHASLYLVQQTVSTVPYQKFCQDTVSCLLDPALYHARLLATISTRKALLLPVTRQINLIQSNR